jgi:signal transduction histidine kinase
LLGQAIANLIDNAIKYGTPAKFDGGDAKPEIGVEAHVKGGAAKIVVTDRGPGVPEAERERVLERFVRLEASRSEPGSGLGLSLVAAVARLHGGRLQLEDNAPGLRVVLSLPAEVNAGLNGAHANARPGAELGRA